MDFKVIIFISLLSLFQSTSLFNLVLLNQYPDALCLDGSFGAYYFSAGTGTNATKFMISFQGGGWCGNNDISSTISSCYSRSATDLGSSNNYVPSMNKTTGIFSGDPQRNPTFYDWNRVLLKYCDGSGHQGTKSSPVNYRGKDIYFRGQNITIAQIQDLDKKYKFLSNSTEIIVSGGSAGGLAAYQWANYIKQNTKAKVWTVPDAGIFLDVINVTSKSFDHRNKIINIMKFSNVEVQTPVKQCNSQYKDELWKCMYTQFFWQLIKTPIFAINTQYDSWSIPNILGIQCAQNSTLESCSPEQIKSLEGYRNNMTKVLRQITSKQGNGAWSVACVYHTEISGSNWISPNFRVPQNSIYSMQYSVSRWKQDSKYELNHIHIDQISWPNNHGCSNVAAIQKMNERHNLKQD